MPVIAWSMHSASAAGLLALLVTIPGSALAGVEDPPPSDGPRSHRGLYVGFAPGLGQVRLTNTNAESGGPGGFTFTLRGGYGLTDNLLVGANVGTLAFDLFRDDGERLGIDRFNLEATYYPVVSGGSVDFYVRGGLGAARLHVPDGDASGVALQVGAGVEKRLGSAFALGAALDGHLAMLSGDVRGDYWELSLTFSWY